MGTGATFANDLLKLIFNAVAIGNIADNAGSSPITNLYAALHTADPSAGDQTTNEIAYSTYARVAILRTSGGWLVTGMSVSPVADIEFPAASSGDSGTAPYFSIGKSSTGAGKILYAGKLSPSIAISSGVAPTITSASTVTES